MIRAQMAGSVGFWLSNRQNDVRDAITSQFTSSRRGGAAKCRFSALSEDWRAAIKANLGELRHKLHAINLRKAWMVPTGAAVMRTINKAQVPVSNRARLMFLGIAARHRWPRFQRLTMLLNDRAGFEQDGTRIWLKSAHPGSFFAWWPHAKTKTTGTPVLLRFDESMTDLVSVSRPRREKSGASKSAPDARLTNPY